MRITKKIELHVFTFFNLSIKIHILPYYCIIFWIFWTKKLNKKISFCHPWSSCVPYHLYTGTWIFRFLCSWRMRSETWRHRQVGVLGRNSPDRKASQVTPCPWWTQSLNSADTSKMYVYNELHVVLLARTQKFDFAYCGSSVFIGFESL